jgi:hypothetical protein
MFLVFGLGAGPMFSYMVHPLRKYINEQTKRGALFGVPSVVHFFGIFIPCVLMTVASFFGLAEHVLGDPGLREPIGLLMFAARYGTFIILGAMALSHLSLKYIAPLRNAIYARSPQVATDLYAPNR